MLFECAELVTSVAVEKKIKKGSRDCLNPMDIVEIK
jgi:hypothetical protein